MLDFATSLEGRDTAGLTSSLFSSNSFAFIGTSPAPPYGTRVIQTQTATNLARTGLSNAATRIIGGLVHFQTSTVGSGHVFLGLGDGDPNASVSAQIGLALDSTGHIVVYRGRGVGISTGGAQLGSASSQAFAANTWYYIELKVLFHASAGTVQVRVNNAASLWQNLTAQDTTQTVNAYANSFAVGAAVSANLTFWKSIVCISGSGGTVTDWIGDVIVGGTVVPAGNGSHTGSTPSSGSDRGAMVDDTPPDGDTTYNLLVAVGAKDTFDPALAIPSGSTVYGVQVSNYVKKTDGGTCDVQAQLLISGTLFSGTQNAVGTAYNYDSHFWELSPATVSTFTPTEVNALEVGLKRAA